VTPRDERVVWGIWSPDGTQVVFEKLEAGRGTLHMRLADGTGKAERIAEPRPAFQTPASWSPAGRLAFVEAGTAMATDIRVLDMTTRDRPDSVVVQTEGADSFPAFSPDGKWLAYSSSVSGRSEVYVQPFPGPGPRVLVSTSGGTAPAWRGDSRELYYYWTDGTLHMYAVPIAVAGPTLSAGAPRQLFEGRFSTTGPARGYDVTPDGQRFLFVRHLEPPPPPPGQLILVENFAEELKPRARKE
jgi:eukaryotic-like serine/threonine-protein kinase